MATKAVLSADEITPDHASHPGELLAEELEERGMSQRALAQKIGRPVQAINEICRGRKRITAETALALQDALGISAHVWLGLQVQYDLVQANNARQRLASA